MELKLKKVFKKEDKYLIITDLDGTFLSNGANMTHHIKNNVAVKKIRELGHEFIIASGRSPQLIKPIYDHLNLDTPIIAFHGALILDPTNKHKKLSLNDSFVPIELVKEIVKETNIIENTIFTEIIGYGESNSITHQKDSVPFATFPTTVRPLSRPRSPYHPQRPFPYRLSPQSTFCPSFFFFLSSCLF